MHRVMDSALVAEHSYCVFCLVKASFRGVADSFAQHPSAGSWIVSALTQENIHLSTYGFCSRCSSAVAAVLTDFLFLLVISMTSLQQQA